MTWASPLFLNIKKLISGTNQVTSELLSEPVEILQVLQSDELIDDDDSLCQGRINSGSNAGNKTQSN